MKIGRFNRAEGDAAGKFTGNCTKAFQAADDRFQTRFAGLCESFAGCGERAFGQRRSVCRRHYLSAAAGWQVLLSGMFQDKFTRRIVGWKVAERMTAQLVIDVFLQARRRGLIGKNAIIHTDQGSQYAAVEYRRLLYIGGFRQSMSRKGNCYDNAQAESFFSRFKAELVENGIFESVEDARSEVFSYIEGYYNRIRLHSGLGYKSPMEFEKQLKLKNKIRSSESFVS